LVYFDKDFDIIKIKKIHPNAVIPEYKTVGAAAFDLTVVENYVLFAQEAHLFSTGLVMEIPKGYFGYIRPRSGLAVQYGIGILSSNVIDCDYRGEVKINLYNYNSYKSCEIKAGERVAQMLILPAPQFKIVEETGNLSNTERGEGGFGSTGVTT
jgi:dUTP pyrophosphatase